MSNSQSTGGRPPEVDAPQSRRRWSALQALVSARLTLWLLAILAIAMAVATLIPQRAPEAAYLKVFGTLLGPLIAKTTLHNIYGSWWFVGTFGLLAVNLLACSIRRSRQLILQDMTLADRPAETEGGQARWRVEGSISVAADKLTAVLRRAGYSVSPLSGGENGERRLAARKGRLSLWAPVVTHVGMVLVLIGAAWGRMPSHAYQATAMLGPGEVFAAQPPGEAFGLRLNDFGVEHSATGRPKRYWAKVEVLEEGMAVRSQTVEPNRPLRYHGVSVSLQSIGEDAPTQETVAVVPAAWQIEVKARGTAGTVPIIVSEDGQVQMMESSLKLDDPPWFVFVAKLREVDEAGHRAPAARVFVDRSGSPSHNWELVGWVGTAGLDYGGVHFQLVSSDAGAVAPMSHLPRAYAQLALDRDIGVPIVYFGFIVVSLGTLAMLGPGHRRVSASVKASGKGSQICLALSPASDHTEAERLRSGIESELGGDRESGPARTKETTPCVS